MCVCCVYEHTSVYVYIFVYMDVQMYIYVCCIRTCMYMCVYMCVYVCVHMCPAYVRVCLWIHVCTCVGIGYYMYLYVCDCPRVCLQVLYGHACVPMCYVHGKACGKDSALHSYQIVFEHTLLTAWCMTGL